MSKMFIFIGGFITGLVTGHYITSTVIIKHIKDHCVFVDDSKEVSHECVTTDDRGISDTPRTADYFDRLSDILKNYKSTKEYDDIPKQTLSEQDDMVNPKDETFNMNEIMPDIDTDDFTDLDK